MTCYINNFKEGKYMAISKNLKKEKPLIIKISGLRVRLDKGFILSVLTKKGIEESHYESKLLDQKIKLCKEHITVDDLAAHQINIVSGA
jgi:phage gp16-like protein